MSECPNCHKHTRQEWSDGYPATIDTPEEHAGFECGWCGHTYGSKWDREAAKADALYDERRMEE